MRKTLPKTLISMTGGDPRAKSEPAPKYSGRFPVPALGSYVTPTMFYAGVKPPVAAGTPMRVIGYDVEHGWLYLVCRHPTGRGTVYVAGCDLPPPRYLVTFVDEEGQGVPRAYGLAPTAEAAHAEAARQLSAYVASKRGLGEPIGPEDFRATPARLVND